MNEIYKNWDFDKFLTFIMYHASLADSFLAAEEKDIILKRINQEEFKDLKEFYKHNSDYDNTQIILYFKEKYCKEKENLEKVLESAENIFKSDGRFHYLEKNMMQGLKILLG